MDNKVNPTPVPPAGHDGPNPATPAPAAPKWRRRLLGAVAAVVLTFYGILGVGAAALSVRLAQGPVDMGFALPAIERIMSRSERMRFDIGGMTLSWNGYRNPLGLEMRDLRLVGPLGEFVTIDRADLGLSAWRLLLAQLHFSYAEIENLSLRVVRQPTGGLTLTGATSDAAAPQKPEGRSVDLRLDNIVNDLPAIDRLHLSDMRVIFEDQQEARIRRFDDVDMEIRQTGTLGRRSVSGYLTAALSGDEGSLAAIDFLYDASDKSLTAMARLERADTRELIGSVLRAAQLPVVDMMVQGRAELRLRNDFSLESLNLRLQGDDGMLYWPRSYGEGLENQKLTKFDLHVGFEPETQTLELQNAEITVKGITLSATGAMAADAAWRRLQGDVRLHIPVLAVDALPAVWPKVWDTGGREWLVDRMEKGRFARIDVHVPLVATRHDIAPDEDDLEISIFAPEMEPEGETSWEFDTGTIRGAFDFTGVTVDYRAPLLPARNTTGKGVYEGLGLTLDIEKANIGNLNVTGGKLEFDDLITPGMGHAHLEFRMTGAVQSVFEYLEKEPISYRDKVSLDAKAARGQAAVDLVIDFPTLADMAVEDVNVTAKAKLTNLTVPGAVKGLTLSGPAFDLEASANHFKITGEGALEGQPATVEWEEVFSPAPGDPFAAKLAAKLQTDKTIRRHFIGSLEDRVDGVIPADISLVTTPAGKGTLHVTADLANAAIDFTNPFNAVKPKGQSATAKLTGTLNNGFIEGIDSLAITGNGMALASGRIAFGRDAAGEPVLARAALKGLRLGDTNADIDATWAGENDIKADVTGVSFDARWIMGETPKTPAAAGAPPAEKTATGYDLKLKLDRMFIADHPLTGVTGEFVGNTGGIIRLANLDAAAGNAPVTLRYAATGTQGDRLLLEAGDAGAGLAALGITNRVRGGTLRVNGAPRSGGAPGDMQGKMVLRNFSIHKAPTLAKLINLLSLPGILNLLNQETGLTFERAEAEFTWLNKPGGAQVFFSDGRTSGASLGLTFEGTVDMAAETVAVQGTVVPMSEVNTLVSRIPLIGNILTGGGKGSGIFAATYTMKGPTGDPDVTINPLSVLTPGILRRILFESPLSVPAAPAP